MTSQRRITLVRVPRSPSDHPSQKRPLDLFRLPHHAQSLRHILHSGPPEAKQNSMLYALDPKGKPNKVTTISHTFDYLRWRARLSSGEFPSIYAHLAR